MNEITKQIELTGMHCQGCVKAIQHALSGVEGVASADVTLAPPQAIVRVFKGMSDEALRAAVQSAGDYDASSIRSPSEQASSPSSPIAEEPRESLYPLLLIVGFILGVTLLVAVRTGTFRLSSLMANFMAGFFIVFGFFKLLDLPGFVRTFAWSGRYRRLSKDYKTLCECSESKILIAMINLMAHRLNPG